MDRCVLAKERYYLISADKEDLEKSKSKRSDMYLGKLKSTFGATFFTGYSYLKVSGRSLHAYASCVYVCGWVTFTAFMYILLFFNNLSLSRL